jgi:hypothetical protein
MEVREVLRKCTDVGLIVQVTGSGHYKIHHPESGAWLFNVSSTPSDPNWFWSVRRHFRRLDLPWILDSKHKRKVKNRPAVDLVALAKAQRLARERGEREPQLADLDETTTSEFWSKNKQVGGMYTDQAMDEVIENMAPRAEAARANLARARAKNIMISKRSVLEEKAKAASGAKYLPPRGEYHIPGFAIALMEVSEQRNMRTFTTVSAAKQSLYRFINKDDNAITNWALAVIEATIDHLDGLKWGVDEAYKKQVEHLEEVPRAPSAIPLPEPEPTTPQEEFGVEINTPVTRLRYANALLLMLERNAINGDNIEPILSRLDKLVGIEV